MQKKEIQKQNHMKQSGADILRNRLLQTATNREISEDTGSKLSDLRGVEYLMGDIKSKMFNILFKADKFKEMNASRPNITLIYGISGVGKKYIVHCFAREYKVKVFNKYFETAQDVKDLFRRAEALENAIVLIDKLDDYEEEKGIIHQINVSATKTTALVIITHKDKNIKMHFDNDIFVKIPRIHDRKAILDGMIEKMQTESIDTNGLAYYTPGFVPRDLNKLVKIASTHAVENGLNFVKMEHFEQALHKWKNIDHYVTFEEIGAMEEVKEELKLSILLPSQFPEKFQKLGIHKPSGILLHGPPGCGKTLIAKAVSNMSHCNFLSIKGPELITKYVGDSEKHLRDLFEKAKNLSPCVLFFDEIDSLCSKRGTNEFGNRIVNQILTLLDGMEDRGEVYLIGATNRIDQIDDAMLRTGRFDKVVEVKLPTKEGAVEIFKKCTKNILIEQFDVTELDLERMSGADIAGVAKEAALLCIKDNFDKDQPIILRKYFDEAIHKIKMMKK
ncbi:Y1297 [Enterospora canceri]|uniref:Y1297 n=1 Tax=Enterospora canceri TaxID=1081671 RepID=A0A1Y1S5V8_9MICR|nr:Y1297 [Enterospora canceri]